MNGLENNSTEFLSKKVSNAVKGISALLVLFHHFYQRTHFISQPYVAKIFEVLGYLAVSVFFFYSGYGLMISYKNKKETYIQQFPKKRLLPFYCSYLLFIFITLIEKIFIGDNISLLQLIKSFFIYGTIVTYGWYFQAILLFYILFYFIFRYVKNEKNKVIVLTSLVILYTITQHLRNVAPALYISTLSFVLGVFWCYFDVQSKKILEKRKKSLLVSGGLFVLLVVISFLTTNRHLRYIPRTLSSPLFVIFILMIISIIHQKRCGVLVNKITNWLGKNSLEIYVSQGMFFELFRSNLIYIHNSYIYIVTVFICTMLFSPVLHEVVKFINKLCSKEI